MLFIHVEFCTQVDCETILTHESWELKNYIYSYLLQLPYWIPKYWKVKKSSLSLENFKNVLVQEESVLIFIFAHCALLIKSKEEFRTEKLAEHLILCWVLWKREFKEERRTRKRLTGWVNSCFNLILKPNELVGGIY